MGVAPANVALTGSYTIPLMKKTGFTPEQASAIEAVASTGGQFTPPDHGGGRIPDGRFFGDHLCQPDGHRACPGTIVLFNGFFGCHPDLTKRKYSHVADENQYE